MLLPDIFTQGTVDTGLIAFFLRVVVFEPVDQIRVQPERNLPFVKIQSDTQCRTYAETLYMVY